MCGMLEAREEQQARCLGGPGRQDDMACRFDVPFSRGVDPLHAGGLAVLHQDLRDHRFGPQFSLPGHEGAP